MNTPFSLCIFVADGDPDGLCIVDKFNLIGIVMLCQLRCPTHHTSQQIHQPNQH